MDVALDACRKGVGCGRFLAYQVRAAEATGEPRRGAAARRLGAAGGAGEPALSPRRLLPSRVRAFVDLR